MTCHRQIDNRGRLYTLLAVGKRELGMDEETYRSFLLNHGAGFMQGRISAKTMNIGQLEMALEAMKRQGFRPGKGNYRRRTQGADWRRPRIDKITALWCALADAGVVHDRGAVAMERWCAGITHKARLEWAGSLDLNACIEGLKKWAWREKVPVD